MAYSIKDVNRRKSGAPPRVFIYGPSGVGKTSLAAQFPSPIFIQTEDGGGLLELNTFSDRPMRDYNEVRSALNALANEDHDFKTVVIDSVTRLEPLISDHICKQNGWKNIASAAYGVGYVEMQNACHKFVKGLFELRAKQNMAIIMIAHEAVENFADPTVESYNRFAPRLDKKVEPIFREDMDIVGFMSPVVTPTEEKRGGAVKAKGSEVFLRVTGSPAVKAKNRYDMPDLIPIRPGQGYEALKPYLPGQDFSGAVAPQDTAA